MCTSRVTIRIYELNDKIPENRLEPPALGPPVFRPILLAMEAGGEKVTDLFVESRHILDGRFRRYRQLDL